MSKYIFYKKSTHMAIASQDDRVGQLRQINPKSNEKMYRTSTVLQYKTHHLCTTGLSLQAASLDTF